MAQLDLTAIAATSIATPSGGVESFFVDSTTKLHTARDDGGILRQFDASIFSIVPAGDFNLLTTSGVQSAFPTTGDVFTLEASKAYFMEGMYIITKTTTTVTVAMAFASAGGGSVTSIAYWANCFNGAFDTTTATLAGTFVDTIATTVINATSTANTVIYFKGILRTNAAGTITPQINFSANTTVPVMKVNSFIKFTAIGTNTTNIIGPVA